MSSSTGLTPHYVRPTDDDPDITVMVVRSFNDLLTTARELLSQKLAAAEAHHDVQYVAYLKSVAERTEKELFKVVGFATTELDDSMSILKSVQRGLAVSNAIARAMDDYPQLAVEQRQPYINHLFSNVSDGQTHDRLLHQHTETLSRPLCQYLNLASCKHATPDCKFDVQGGRCAIADVEIGVPVGRDAASYPETKALLERLIQRERAQIEQTSKALVKGARQVALRDVAALESGMAASSSARWYNNTMARLALAMLVFGVTFMASSLPLASGLAYASPDAFSVLPRLAPVVSAGLSGAAGHVAFRHLQPSKPKEQRQRQNVHASV